MYTFTDLLDDIKLRGAIPTDGKLFTSARFLSLVNDEIRSAMMPFILKLRENNYSYDIDQAVNATGVYDIPSRAAGAKIEGASLVNGDEIIPVSLMSEVQQRNVTESPDGRPSLFIKRNQLYLRPVDANGWPTLRITIFLRPANVVLNESGAQITGISGHTLSFASGALPTAWSTSSTFDLVQGSPHFDTVGVDLAATSLTSTTVVLSASPSSRLTIGDWLSLATESPVIQIPEVLHALLAQRVANICMRVKGDKVGLAEGKSTVTEMEKGLTMMLAPRTERQSKKVVNRTGILRRH